MAGLVRATYRGTVRHGPDAMTMKKEERQM
jgi:hypothetical protein